METTRLSSKGQVVLPKSIRRARRWSAGMEFAVEEASDGVLLRPLRPFPATTLTEVIACTGYRGHAKTLKDMERAIERGAKERRR